MGTNGLWKTVLPARRRLSLNDLAIKNGYTHGRPECALRIGIDLSTVMNECIGASRVPHRYRVTADINAKAMEMFFFKVCTLLRSFVIPIFVREGSGRPSFKRGVEHDTETEPWWNNHCAKIIEAVGFHLHDAPGEAEAELSKLNNLGLIDAVLSTDSDCLVFGARCVVQHVTGSELYNVYSADVVEEETSLNRDGLRLFSLLAGNDYGEGIKGCGGAIAHGLSQTKLARELFAIYESTDLSTFQKRNELTLWRLDLCDELCLNKQKRLRSKFPGIADNIPIRFPDARTVNLIVSPLTSFTPPMLPPPSQTWVSREPDIAAVAKVCTTILKWKKESIVQRLQKTFWPGVFVRILLSPNLSYSGDDRHIFAASCNKTSASSVGFRKDSAGVNRGHLHLSAASFILALGYSMDDMILEGLSTFQVSFPVSFLPQDLERKKPAKLSAEVKEYKVIIGTLISQANLSLEVVPPTTVEAASTSIQTPPTMPRAPQDLLELLDAIINDDDGLVWDH